MDDAELTALPLGATDLERAQADRIAQLVVDRDEWRSQAISRSRGRQFVRALLLLLMAAVVSGLLAWLVTNVNDRAQANVPRQKAVLCLTARIGLTTEAVNDLLDHPNDPAYEQKRIEALHRLRAQTLYVTLPGLRRPEPCPPGAEVSASPP